ncbi:hypothetical protein B4U79_16513 [Dinothrombium tinctorium]|uniref:Acetylserotonin O-methyltransferase n=1 Tax=Dinothrombium tinctorium TaxID=1965070 RepID=A0A3S3P8M2_9ACAR|nr:hypothetical protein B4U79_16513 [Dinothrombium tinctorium]
MARLKIADNLDGEPQTAEELAVKTHTNAPLLFRLLRALAGLGLVRADEEKRFHLTPLGRTMRTKGDGAFGDFMEMFLGDQFLPWTKYVDAIRTGKTQFDQLYGVPYYEHLKKNPDERGRFVNGLKQMTKIFNANITDYYDFTPFKHIVDIAGSDGTFLINILKNVPHARGTVFDEEPSIEAAKKNVLDYPNVKDRLDFVAGSFFTDPIPAGGDCYTMKSALDFEDELAIQILKNIRNKMKSGTKFLVIQTVVPDTDEFHIGKLFDQYLFMLTGGKERTKAEAEHVLRGTGFELNRIIPTTYPLWDILEATAV